MVATALPPPSGKKLAKPWISEPNSRRSTVTPAARIASRVLVSLIAQRVETAVSTSAGGRPDRSSASSGDTRGSVGSIPAPAR